jgi:hypothetical protein
VKSHYATVDVASYLLASPSEAAIVALIIAFQDRGRRGEIQEGIGGDSLGGLRGGSSKKEGGTALGVFGGSLTGGL